MESELGEEGWKEIVIVLENGEYLVMKRGYYYTVLLKAFKSIIRGSVTSALPGVFLEILLSHGIHEGWMRIGSRTPHRYPNLQMLKSLTKRSHICTQAMHLVTYTLNHL